MPVPAPAPPLLRCAGFHLGHPAGKDTLLATRAPARAGLLHDLTASGLFAPPTTFLRLDAALQFAMAPGPHTASVHGLWLPAPHARAMLREETPSRARTLPAVLLALRQGHNHAALPPSTAAGFDVLGFAGDRCWSWQQEPLAVALLQQEGIAPDAYGLLPTAALARRIERALEADDLGAPVLWRCWQRTVHAVSR